MKAFRDKGKRPTENNQRKLDLVNTAYFASHTPGCRSCMHKEQNVTQKNLKGKNVDSSD